jgi:hypothetical protein
MNRREILNPILHESAVAWFPTGDLGQSRTGHTTVVYLTDPASQDPDASQLRRPPTLRQRLRRSYWRYDVDTAHHWTSVGLGLPAKEEAFSFKVWVSLTWNVHDPIAIARTGIQDVKPIIRGFLDQHLRGISRRYSIEQAGLAEEEMTGFLERQLGDIPYGLRLSLISVNVWLDEAAEEYLITRVESRRARALAGDDHELETLRRMHAAEQARRNGDLEREQVAHAAEIERMRADQDRTLAVMAADHELALKRERVKFYQSALRGGGYDVLVLHLIEHPQDVQTVLKMLQEGRKDEYERARAVLKTLLDKDLINAADAEPMREHAIDRLRSAFDITPPTVTFTRESSTRTIEEKTEKASVEVPLNRATS